MDLNPAFDYGSRNFSNIKRDLLRRAGIVAPSWTDRDPSDFGMLFVDLWSYMGDIVHYYIDRASKEAFIQTATQKESVLAFASLYDNVPNFRTSSNATIYVSNTGSASATILDGTEFRVIYNDLYFSFYTNEDITIPPETTANVAVVEGRRVTEEVLVTSADGTPNQGYLLRTPEVVPESIRVFVYEGGIKSEWFRYASVGDIPISVPGFVVNVNPEQEVEILFGDKSSGRIPPSGTLITISYTVSSGTEGNIPENQFVTFASSPSGNLLIQGMTAAVGGSDGESVESIRSALQSVIRSQQRAVTLQDYVDLTLSVNGVSKAVASYESGSGGASVTIYPAPFVAEYQNSSAFSIEVPEEMVAIIEALLAENATVGTTLEVVNSININQVNIEIDITINDKYVNRWVINDVEAAIDSLFSFDALDFGQEIRVSDIYKALTRIEGIDILNVVLIEMRDTNGNFIEEGALSPVELVRKGDVTINALGGITTSV